MALFFTLFHWILFENLMTLAFSHRARCHRSSAALTARAPCVHRLVHSTPRRVIKFADSMLCDGMLFDESSLFWWRAISRGSHSDESCVLVVELAALYDVLLQRP